MGVESDSEPLKQDSSAAEVDSFRLEPGRFFGNSVTRMHSIPRARMDDLQRAALTALFAEQSEAIPVLAKLARSQGIRSGGKAVRRPGEP